MRGAGHGNDRGSLRVAIDHHQAGRLDEAETALEAAKALRPDHPHPVCELAVLKLALGDFEEGLALYEKRWDYTGQSAAVSGKPVWRGEDIAGKTILLYYEQGLGDTLQFVRYAPLLADRGARVLLIVQPELRRLLASVRGVDRLTTCDDAAGLPDFDLCCPLMSLPFALARASTGFPPANPTSRRPPIWWRPGRSGSDGAKSESLLGNARCAWGSSGRATRGATTPPPTRWTADAACPSR
ncbi:tetratricopeptide repeat protein [Azospirillum tabaci]|uniref:tetratricopeptide repeat protein n=1 Tax=Azospirillum tabaci TaxID=2752310 RepID=UPI001661826D|nr:tetratricopeptide repeat protein [Azospirillum tabaci]